MLTQFPQISNGNCSNPLNEINNVTQLQDLNEDVLLEIFEKCKLEQLLDFADMNNRFRELINRYLLILKYRFNKRMLSFSDEDKAITFHNNGSIRICGPDVALKFLRNFGNTISRIQIGIGIFYLISHQRIGIYINEYCSESLEQRNIADYDVNMLRQFRKPFKILLHLAFIERDGIVRKTI